jgi:hypothetical protein
VAFGFAGATSSELFLSGTPSTAGRDSERSALTRSATTSCDTETGFFGARFFDGLAAPGISATVVVVAGWIPLVAVDAGALSEAAGTELPTLAWAGRGCCTAGVLAFVFASSLSGRTIKNAETPPIASAAHISSINVVPFDVIRFTSAIAPERFRGSTG